VTDPTLRADVTVAPSISHRATAPLLLRQRMSLLRSPAGIDHHASCDLGLPKKRMPLAALKSTSDRRLVAKDQQAAMIAASSAAIRDQSELAVSSVQSAGGSEPMPTNAVTVALFISHAATVPLEQNVRVDRPAGGVPTP
jgi:hypothetical protein